MRETMEDCQTEMKNRKMIKLANINYGKIIKELAHLKGINLKVLRMPELLEAMIKREDDSERKWHLEFLRDSLLLWISQKHSTSKNQNVLYYPYHRILEYDRGRKSHETHINNFLNNNARKVIENRLTKRGLFTDKKEYFDYTSSHPSDWHSAAHQNTPVKHSLFEFSTPQYQALGDYSLSGLVKGFTEPDSRGGHHICIANAYSLVNDSFDFDGFQWLGNWNFANQDIAYNGGTPFFNGTFRKFSEASGGYGRDYRIVSNLYEIPPDEINFPEKEKINGNICWRRAQ